MKNTLKYAVVVILAGAVGTGWAMDQDREAQPSRGWGDVVQTVGTLAPYAEAFWHNAHQADPSNGFWVLLQQATIDGSIDMSGRLVKWVTGHNPLDMFKPVAGSNPYLSMVGAFAVRTAVRAWWLDRMPFKDALVAGGKGLAAVGRAIGAADKRILGAGVAFGASAAGLGYLALAHRKVVPVSAATQSDVLPRYEDVVPQEADVHKQWVERSKKGKSLGCKRSAFGNGKFDIISAFLIR